MAREIDVLASRIVQAIKSADVSELDLWLREAEARGYRYARLAKALAAQGYRQEDELALRAAHASFGNAKTAAYLCSRLVELLGEERAYWTLAKAFRRYARALNCEKHNHPDPTQRLFKVLCRHVPPSMAVAAFRRFQIVVPSRIRIAMGPPRSYRTSMLAEVKG